MTIDEAIKHCEEVAHQNEILMKRYDDASGYNRSHNENIRTSGAKGCEQLISLYRQLAEWLRELKMYREVIDNKSFKITDPLDPHRHQVLVVKVTDLYNDFFDF